MSDEHGPLIKPLSEWDYDDQYNGGYYNQLSSERTSRLMECFPSDRVRYEEAQRIFRESSKMNYSQARGF